MPPNFNELPMPAIEENQLEEDNTIKDFLTENDVKNRNSNQDLDTDKDLEDSLLEKIKKN